MSEQNDNGKKWAEMTSNEREQLGYVNVQWYLRFGGGDPKLLDAYTAEVRNSERERIIAELEESKMRLGDMSMDSSMRRKVFNSAIDRAITIVKGKV